MTTIQRFSVKLLGPQATALLGLGAVGLNAPVLSAVPVWCYLEDTVRIVIQIGLNLGSAIIMRQMIQFI
jgi:hypothetical protein